MNNEKVFIRKKLFAKEQPEARKTILVIAHRRHYLNWLAKNSFDDCKTFLVRGEFDLNRKWDPETTFVLPLFLNSKYGRERYSDLFSLACERFKEVDVSCA